MSVGAKKGKSLSPKFQHPNTEKKQFLGEGIVIEMRLNLCKYGDCFSLLVLIETCVFSDNIFSPQFSNRKRHLLETFLHESVPLLTSL